MVVERASLCLDALSVAEVSHGEALQPFDEEFGAEQEPLLASLASKGEASVREGDDLRVSAASELSVVCLLGVSALEVEEVGVARVGLLLGAAAQMAVVEGEDAAAHLGVIDNAAQPELAVQFGLDPDNVMDYDFEDAKNNIGTYIEEVMDALSKSGADTGEDRFKTA